MKYSKFYFFYKARHPFSNWFRVKFTDQNGISYNCSEQYMMYQKAILFGDIETGKKILLENDQSKQKELGRQVKGFDSKVWEENAKKIVYEGCKLKFTQNRGILQDLFSTHGKLLVEASPYDRIWGIGLSEDDPLRLNPKNWKGSNWLGETLTKLREDLEKEYETNR